MTFDPDRVRLMLKLLERMTSLELVSAFLKSKGAPHSAPSWRTLYEARILPALNDGLIAEAGLLELLREAEEHGRQHVFLYHVKKKGYAETLIDRERVRKALARAKTDAVVDEPLVLDMPDEPTIAEVRWEAAKVDLALLVKVVETRGYFEFLQDRTEHRDGRSVYIKEWVGEKQRAVTVARLGRDGVLELRIASKKNSTKYEEELDRLWVMLEPVLHRGDFGEVSLSRAKSSLWELGQKSADVVRYVVSRLRNDRGASMVCAVADPQLSLLDEAGIPQGLDAFARRGKAYCDRSNLWFVQRERGLPSRDVHVLLSGMVHEFAVPAACTREDYEHVVQSIRHHNR